MRYRTLVFDLDGTISDPFEGISKSINYALDASGFPSVDPEAVRPLIGPPLTAIFERLLGPLSESTMLQLVDQYRERYATVGYAENVLYEGIPPILARLAEQGCTMGICTSKRQDYAKRIVEMFGLAQYFSFVDGGGAGVEKRQQIEQMVANGLATDTAIMIGDRAVDIHAGKSNALAAAGVLWGFGERAELESAAPDFIVDRPAELLNRLLN